MEILDDPDALKEELRVIQGAWKSIICDIYDIVKKNNYGGSCIYWMGSWAPGLHSQMQVDMAAMLSPDQYREFAVPELRAQAALMDHPCYHLDGREQLRHLDAILSVPNLQMIQYTFVDGQPSPIEQLPALRRIQEAGKLLLLIIDNKYVQPMLENLSAKGLFIETSCGDPEEAENLFALVKRESKERG
jgi:hypothetical protein